MRALVLLPIVLLACGSPIPRAVAPRAEDPIWVLAPHPDDEALIASHVIASAVEAGRPVFVHVMTNGDLGCGRDGWRRERETVDAMAELGLPEDRIRFLGYPDGYLDALGSVPLAPLARRARDGSCTEGNTTYGDRGEGRADVHTARTGAPGVYTDENAISDLVALLERDRPSDVYTSHPIDDHPDHATTYVLLRRALERADLDRIPTIHRALVHAGGCWPNGSAVHEPCAAESSTFGTPYPPLPAPLGEYVPTERLLVPDGGARGRRAIAHYVSQLHTRVDGDWLGTFARGDAVYWPETLERERTRLVRTRAPGVRDGHARHIAETIVQDPDDPTRTREVIEFTQRVPLAIGFSAAVPAGSSARLHVLARSRMPAAGYAIEIVDGETVTIARSDRVIERVHVPDDGARHAQHHWWLRLDPRPDEGVLELELRRDGALLAVAVDAAPFVEGDLVIESTRTIAELEVLSIDAVREAR